MGMRQIVPPSIALRCPPLDIWNKHRSDVLTAVVSLWSSIPCDALFRRELFVPQRLSEDRLTWDPLGDKIRKGHRSQMSVRRSRAWKKLFSMGAGAGTEMGAEKDDVTRSYRTTKSAAVSKL